MKPNSGSVQQKSKSFDGDCSEFQNKDMDLSAVCKAKQKTALA